MPDTATASLDEMRGLLDALPGPAAPAESAESADAAHPAGAAGGLGLLDALNAWLVAWQDRRPPRLDRPRLAVFAGAHGIAGVASPGTPVARRVEGFRDGSAPVNALCRQQDCEMRVYEMALDRPTADFRAAPALSDAACATAMAYGMTAVEDGLDAIALTALGDGGGLSAAALCCGLFGGAPGDWLPEPPDQDPADAAIVASAVKRHRAAADDPMQMLRRLGGHELAATAGAVIAARMGRVPVILDGYAATAAAAVLHRLNEAALDHCILGTIEAGGAHARLLAALGKEALLDIDVGGGDGCGAALALGVLRSALACG